MVSGKIFQTEIYYRYHASKTVKYDLIFTYQRAGVRIKLLYAEMFDPLDNHFMGTWQACYMSAVIKRGFEKWILKKYDFRGELK